MQTIFKFTRAYILSPELTVQEVPVANLGRDSHSQKKY